MDPIHVLLVEDEQTLAMIIKDTLEGQGFRIRLAKDGEEGLRLFFEQKPDVLVADVMMPRMDGFEMVRRIRRSDAVTPVLFLTALCASRRCWDEPSAQRPPPPGARHTKWALISSRPAPNASTITAQRRS